MERPVEIVLKDDGFYEITFKYPKEKINDLIIDSRYGENRNIANLITNALAEKYVNENYAELKKLIDLDLVKLLATRKLAGVVASDN